MQLCKLTSYLRKKRQFKKRESLTPIKSFNKFQFKCNKHKKKTPQHSRAGAFFERATLNHSTKRDTISQCIFSVDVRRHDLAIAGLEIGFGKSERVFGFNMERNITARENRSVLYSVHIPFQKRKNLDKCAGVVDRNGDRIAGKNNRLTTGFAERIGNLEIAIGQVADAGSRYDRIAIDPKCSGNIGLFAERIIGNRPLKK